jgi:hypothetical protein
VKALELASVLVLVLVACAAQSNTPASTPPAQSGDNNAPAVTPAPSSSTTITNTAPADTGAPSPASPGAPSTEPSPPPPAGTKTLPLVAVKSVGMHIGGGPNDAAGKAPFEKAIEQHFPDFLRCYRLVTEPGKGGTFGVDLHIERNGGKPRVEQPRTALGGDPFKSCMLSAFEAIDFPALKKPSVVSYSLRFTVEP